MNEINGRELIPSTIYVSLMVISAHGVETSVSVTKISLSHHLDDHTSPSYNMTPRLKPFTILNINF